MIMNLVDADMLDDGHGLHNSSLQCSICLDSVLDDGKRSWAKLRCGHQFHLDCIGSAFNVKNAMQCPNCREIETGQWLYANQAFPDHGIEDWHNDDDLFDHAISDMSFGLHWCPVGGLARLQESLNERIQLSPTTYPNLVGPGLMYTDHGAVSSATHPYVTYVGPLHPSSSNPGRSTVPDNVGLFGNWSVPPVHSEMPTSYTFPTMDIHYQSWEHHSSPFPNNSNTSHIAVPDQSSIASLNQRAVWTNQDLQRPTSFMNPLLVGHNTATGGTSTITPSPIPPYRGSFARTQDRVQALETYFQQGISTQTIHPASVIPGIPRSSSNQIETYFQQGISTTIHPSVIPSILRPSSNQMGSSSSSLVPPMAAASAASSSSDQAAGFYYFPSGGNFQATADNHHLSAARFGGEWEREQVVPPPTLGGGDFVLEREPSRVPINYWSATTGGGTSNGFFHQRHAGS
ncbi:E3 ubiquitin-protein ligase IPI1 [Impatiens glandulifera]|uniref:E3 ubiquitin-protein ligase IPI1 n=1 Tax=Impatiens glandulifera TaxID=253017 RepID=UPI001FB1722A|nr:E3 ubiquitin-protein ligase IPI1 [Impatiens glandulifera]